MGAGQVARCRRQAVTAPSEARPGPPRNVGRRVREPTKEWRKTMRNFFKGLWKDESGAAAAEYALIMAVIGAGMAVIAIALGDNSEARSVELRIGNECVSPCQHQWSQY